MRTEAEAGTLMLSFWDRAELGQLHGERVGSCSQETPYVRAWEFLQKTFDAGCFPKDSKASQDKAELYI